MILFIIFCFSLGRFNVYLNMFLNDMTVIINNICLELIFCS